MVPNKLLALGAEACGRSAAHHHHQQQQQQQRRASSGRPWQRTWRTARAWPAPVAFGAACAAPLGRRAVQLAARQQRRQPPPAASPSSPLLRSAALLRCSAPLLRPRSRAAARIYGDLCAEPLDSIIDDRHFGPLGRSSTDVGRGVLRQPDLGHSQFGWLRRHTRVKHDLGRTAGRSTDAGRSTRPEP